MAKTAAEADPPAVITVPFFLVCMALPYFLGCLISTHNLAAMQTLLGPLLAVTTHAPPQKRRASVPLRDLDQCYQKLLVKMHRGRDQKRRDEPFTNLKIVMHRNGQSRPCGDTGTAHVMQEFKQALEEMNECPTDYGDKYQVEALWTRVLHRLVATACPSEDGQPAQAGFYGYCDMGPDKTPILPDHGDLVPVVDTATPSGTEYLPCHFHTHQGLRVTSLPYLAQLARHAVAPKTATNDECKVDGDNDDDVSATCAAAALNDKEEEMLSRDEQQQQPRELHLYAVPAGRVFMHAPSHVGEIIALPHVQGGDPSKLVYLEVLSVSPRVFELVNFFTKTESADLVERALKETSESHRIKQSSTGAVGYNLNSKRTSESGFDTTGKTAMIVKKRCFDVLGFDEYQESFSDGLQILRYNLTKAYVSHMDWIEASDLVEHDYDSAGKGGNRFSTILLYMSDLGPDDGGETVFTEAWPVGQAEEDRVSSTSALIKLRKSEQGKLLEKGSWEEKMVAQCRSRLAIRPNSARAVLFYSQLPNGEEDKASLHGGCPVLSGDKWAANLWVWNTPRLGYSGNPKNPSFKGTTASRDVEETQNATFKKVTATFENKGEDPLLHKAKLYFGEQEWAKLGKRDGKVAVTTFKGHVWNVQVDGRIVHSWTIETEEARQDFSI